MGEGKPLPEGTIGWRAFFENYARGEYDDVGKIRPLFNPRLWASLAITIFVALVSDPSQNTPARALFFVVFGAFGWVVWAFVLSVLCKVATACGAPKSDEGEKLFDFNASSAVGLVTMLFYSVIRMQDARSWITLVESGNTNKTTVIIIGSCILGAAILWSTIGRMLWSIYMKKKGLSDGL